MAKEVLQNVRGTKDLFGYDLLIFNKIIDVARVLSAQFAYQELQTPIFEFSEVFERNLGESSDVISKEVYKFLDRGDNFLTLRPEFTASVVRALISNHELQQRIPVKFFSWGPLFRYDRPQRGRQRQFHQINFESFGDNSIYSDVEGLMLAKQILDSLKIKNSEVKLLINSLGSQEAKDNFSVALQEFFQQYYHDLSSDSQRRIATNPIRILDSKNAKDIEISKEAPKINSFFDIESTKRFYDLQNLLTKTGIDFTVAENLVRGLDYYTSTVFEFVSNYQSAQNTIIAGGRYNNLVEQMGFKSLPAFGFAAGLERLALETGQDVFSQNKNLIFVAYIAEGQQDFAFNLASKLRKESFCVDFVANLSFKKQLKIANNTEANWLILVGEDELLENKITLKNLKTGSQIKLAIDSLLFFLKNN
jgi:histidyl-tRNA synthetase